MPALCFGVMAFGRPTCFAPRGPWKGHRLALDLRLPLYRDLNGYQLETDYKFTIGWQKAW